MHLHTTEFHLFWMDFHLLQPFQQKDFEYRCCVFYIIILQKKTWTKAMPRLCTFYRFQLANPIILSAEYPSNRNRFLAKIYKRLWIFFLKLVSVNVLVIMIQICLVNSTTNNSLHRYLLCVLSLMPQHIMTCGTSIIAHERDIWKKTKRITKCKVKRIRNNHIIRL